MAFKKSILNFAGFMAAFSMPLAAIAAALILYGRADDTSFPAKLMAATKSQSVLMADCRNNVRVSCYELARKIDKSRDKGPPVGKSLYAESDAAIVKFGYGKACDLKYSDACWNLGLNYEFPGLLNDMSKAIAFAGKDCQLGNQKACGKIGRLKSLQADMPCIKANDFVNASQDKEAEKLANSLPGHDLCIYVLGAVNERRHDYAASAKYFRAAAALGDPYAMLHLGNQYDAGHGVAQSSPDALDWFRKALAATDAPEYKGYDDRFVALIKSDIQRMQSHQPNNGG